MAHTTPFREHSKALEAEGKAQAFVLHAKHLASGRALRDSTDPRLDTFKAAVTGMTGSNSTNLRQQLSAAYIAILSQSTLLGRMVGWTPAAVGTPMAGLRHNDPNATWIAEGAAIPLARVDMSAPRTGIAKFGTTVAFSTELAKLTDARSERLFERQLTRALARSEDRLLLDDNAAIDGEQPEGLLHDAMNIGPSSPLALDEDLVSLWTSVVDGEAAFPYFVCSPRAGMYLSTLHDSGAPRFPNIGPKGGDIAGVPVLTSPAAAHRLVLVAAEHLVVTDEGLDIERSENAVVVMDDAPNMDVTTPTATNVTSAWQTNTTVLRAIRYLSWLKLRSDCVAYLELPIGGSPS